MNSAIILRNIPKKVIKLDQVIYPNIKGGFRGFYQVPPGLHYISVLSSLSHIGFWCFLKPNDAVVKVFNSEENCFENDESESENKFKNLALSGAMGAALKNYPLQYFPVWHSMSCYIREEFFPPTIYELELPSSSRFESSFKVTHDGNIDFFLQEFQFSFLKWYCSTLTDTQELSAFERWTHLLQSIYNAGEGNISESPRLFIELTDTIIAQFSCLNEDYFGNGSSVIENINYLIEDMRDSGNTEAKEKALALEVYLENKL